MRDKKIAIISAVVVLLAAALCYGLCFKALDGDSAKAGSESGEVTTPTPASIANPSDKEIEIEAPGEKVRYEMVDSHLHYLDELKEALAYNRNCNIIWAHVGISRRVEVQDLIDIANDLLAENPNLYIDISWVVYDYYFQDRFPDNYLDGNTMDDWVDLIEKYPDRIMIGTDKVGHWDTYPAEVVKYYELLDKPDPETAKKVTCDNALALIKTY